MPAKYPPKTAELSNVEWEKANEGENWFSPAAGNIDNYYVGAPDDKTTWPIRYHNGISVSKEYYQVTTESKETSFLLDVKKPLAENKISAVISLRSNNAGDDLVCTAASVKVIEISGAAPESQRVIEVIYSCKTTFSFTAIAPDYAKENCSIAPAQIAEWVDTSVVQATLDYNEIKSIDVTLRIPKGTILTPTQTYYLTKAGKYEVQNGISNDTPDPKLILLRILYGNGTGEKTRGYSLDTIKGFNL
jgi:hypothetical protein